MEFDVKVPIKPHLKKFLVHYYNSEIIPISRKDMLGVIIMSLLNKDHNPHEKYISRPVAELTFRIGEFNAKRSGFFMSNYNVALVNNYLDSLFRFLFSDSVSKKLNGAIPEKGFYKNEARQFFKFYGIEEEEFALDSFLKDFYRARTDNKNLGANCPLFIGKFQFYSHNQK